MYDMDIATLVKDKLFKQDFLQAAEDKDIKADSIWGISIKFGKKGRSILFDWEDGEIK